MPKEIIIVGCGVFGLTTALSLSKRWGDGVKITVVDKSEFPAPDGSSIDISRIVRADYKDRDYATLGLEALAEWKADGPGMLAIGKEGRFHESGLIIVADKADDEYVMESYSNVISLLGDQACRVEELKSREEIKSVLGTGGMSGSTGYINRTSGWAHAENAMKYLKNLCDERQNIKFLTAEVTRVNEDDNGSTKIVKGVELLDGTRLEANLTILATGAWTIRLINLTGRAISTGQILGYLKVTPNEEKKYSGIPTILNLTSGIAVFPPHNGVLKVLRHSLGYLNTGVVQLNGKEIQVSIPRTASTDPGLRMPKEGEDALRQGIREIIPEFANRPFDRTRICWYTDTPTGDFVVSYVPGTEGLFLATGGSGHAFKFLPVLGDEIVNIIEGNKTRFSEKWRWRESVVELVSTADGSRGAEDFQLELAELLNA